jgi:hypothetical protein
MCQQPIGYDLYKMSQEIMIQLPGHHKYCVEHLWVSCLCVFQNLTNEVYRLLFQFCIRFWSFNGDDCVSGCDIEWQHVIGLWWNQCWQGLQISLELDESHHCLIIPLKAICFMQQLVEKHATLARFGYESAECSHHVCQLLYFSLGLV